MASHEEKTGEGQKSKLEEEQHRPRESHEIPAMTPEEAQEIRAPAQQKSIDFVRTVEELFAKANPSGTTVPSQTKESVVPSLGDTTTYITGIGSQAYEAAKDTTFTAGQKTAELANQAAGKIKDTVLSAAGYTAEMGKQGYEAAKNTAFSGTGTGETGIGKAENAVQTKEKTGEAKENLGGLPWKMERETGIGSGKGEKIVVKELPEIEVTKTDGKSTGGGTGGIIEAVGIIVTEAATAAKKKLLEGEPECK